MWRRSILIVAAVAAPLAFSAVDVSAQGRGQERSGEVRQDGTPPTAGKVVTELPAGIQQKVDNGGEVPQGLARRMQPSAQPQAEPEPEPQPEPEPDPEPCSTSIVMVGFQLYIVDCNGNMFPL